MVGALATKLNISDSKLESLVAGEERSAIEKMRLNLVLWFYFQPYPALLC